MIIVEDGSLVPNANSYVTQLEVETYASLRGYNLPSGDKLPQAIITACDYLDDKNWLGDKVGDKQSLAFPRRALDLNCQALKADEIPKAIKTAQILLVVAIANGANLTPSQSVGNIISKSVGSVSVTYDNPSSATAYIPQVQALINPFLSRVLKVLRA